MKRILFFFAMAYSTSVWAQERLIVKYEYRMEMDFNEFMKDRRQMRLSPEMQKSTLESITEPRYFKLQVSADESLYTSEVKLDNSQTGDGMRGSQMRRGANPLYKNLKENYFMQTKVSLGKNFLVKNSLTHYDWKITKEKKEILGYEVRKAEFKDSTRTVSVWYAPKLPFKTGPEYLQGLPGLILDVEIDITDGNGKKSKYIWNVLSVEVDMSSSAIVKPSKGKPVSENEFQQFIKELHKKNLEMYGDGVDKD